MRPGKEGEIHENRARKNLREGTGLGYGETRQSTRKTGAFNIKRENGTTSPEESEKNWDSKGSWSGPQREELSSRKKTVSARTLGQIHDGNHRGQLY